LVDLVSFCSRGKQADKRKKVILVKAFLVVGGYYRPMECRGCDSEEGKWLKRRGRGRGVKQRRREERGRAAPTP